ncbi:unnamed protein product [Linum trigynum]|uniref:Uncharacterized protein n=1 Tax=Linum trigynum TaxID=586398 RepID=A0AAV2F9X8_9ROSI
MGTKVQCESYFPGHFQMRDLSDESNSCSWPLYYGDKTFTNGQYYNGFMPKAITDTYSGYDKDLVKRTMLEHETIFRNQLYELHRLYRIQRDLMDEVKRKETPQKSRVQVDASLSSSPLASQVTPEDARKWHIPSFPLGNSVSARPSTSAIENINSPLSSVRGSSTYASPFPYKNGSTSKDVEILESRPTKVRRKMFDLQLPADEYIDTEEGAPNNVSGKANQLVKGNLSNISKNGFSQNNCQDNGSLSESCLRGKISMADLNEPIVIEETNPSEHVSILGDTPFHGEVRGTDLDGKQKSRLRGSPDETPHRGSDNGPLTRPDHQSNGIGKQWLTHVDEAGHAMNNLKSVSETLQAERFPSSSRSMQALPNDRALEPPNFSVTDQKKNQSRDRSSHGVDLSERSPDDSNNSCHRAVIASGISNPYLFAPDLSKSWSHSALSWEKPTGILNQNGISVQLHPHLNSSSATLSKSSQSSTQSNGIFGDRWNWNNTSSTSNHKYGNEVSNRNGYYHGISTGLKELQFSIPSGSYGHVNCGTADNAAAQEQLINHASVKFYQNSSYMDLKPIKDVNLNVAISNGISNKEATRHGIESIDLERKDDENLSSLPWLRGKPTFKSEASSTEMVLNAGKLSFLDSTQNLTDKSFRGSLHPVWQGKKLASHSINPDATRIEVRESAACRKILGFPIFQSAHAPKTESLSFTSPYCSIATPSETEAGNKVKNVLFDMNMPFDDLVAVADFARKASDEVELVNNGKDTKKVSNVRCEIDLNSCVSEDEAALLSSVPYCIEKTVTGIDLEAPIVPEIEENVECIAKVGKEPSLASHQESEIQLDEFVRVAAEAIVSISSSSAPQDRAESASCTLHWFAEIISSCGDDLESKFKALSRVDNNDLSSFEEFDYFELMTLKLTETKEKDYMPEPLVPKDLILEVTGPSTVVPTKSRRGNARRGRQRRDFQRDILPGLVSLSRHEVTEDIQTFGGLMRATGHAWQSGLLRRNSTRSGCGRGRRRLVVSPPPPPTPPVAVAVSPLTPCAPLIHQLSSIEVGMEDRSLRGWGKTTRRPRRQRCPAGNLPTLPVT